MNKVKFKFAFTRGKGTRVNVTPKHGAFLLWYKENGQVVAARAHDGIDEVVKARNELIAVLEAKGSMREAKGSNLREEAARAALTSAVANRYRLQTYEVEPEVWQKFSVEMRLPQWQRSTDIYINGSGLITIARGHGKEKAESTI